MKLVFLGPPGAGKGTQAEKMAEEFNLKHASTGDIFREAVAEGSELGETVSEYLDSGRLVPDELTSEVVKVQVLEKYEDFILDGFPRTEGQAEALTRMMAELDQELDAVVYFELSAETAKKRLTGRLVCSECGANYHEDFMPPEKDGICDRCGGALKRRSDSTEEAVDRRLTEYQEKTAPLVGYYRERGLLQVVDGSQTPGAVAQATKEILKSLG